MLKKAAPGLRLIVSYADSNQNHHGGIYQAAGWVFVGKTSSDYQYVDSQGRHWHSRQVSSSGVKTQYGERRQVVKTSDCKKIKLEGKWKYLLPLDSAMKGKIEALRRKAPQRATSIGADAPGHQPGEGGSQPTVALQSKEPA